jgi:hypothetical protein
METTSGAGPCASDAPPVSGEPVLDEPVLVDPVVDGPEAADVPLELLHAEVTSIAATVAATAPARTHAAIGRDRLSRSDIGTLPW